MAIIVKEKWDGRRQKIGNDPSEDIEYLIFGTDDDTAAEEAMYFNTPLFWEVGNWVLPRQSAGIDQRLAEDIWLGHVNWSWGTPPEVGDQLVSFDTTGGTQKIYQSLATAKYAAPGQIAPDFQGAIGVTDDGIEGVDIIVPALSFSIQCRYSPDFVTRAWVKSVSALTGQTNAAPFYGFDASEVRFDGATGQQQLGKPWDVTCKFTASQNAEDLQVGPITVESKLGWQYLWVRYMKQSYIAGGNAIALVQVPRAAYVEDVLQTGDFSILLIN